MPVVESDPNVFTAPAAAMTVPANRPLYRGGIEAEASIPKQRKIGLLVVDSQPIVAEGLRSVAAHCPNIELVGVCTTGERALKIARMTRADVMLIDLRMSPMTGLQLLLELRRDCIPCRSIVFSSYDSDEDILQAIEAGAVGYLCKSSRPADIISGVVAAAEGKLLFPSHIRLREDRRARKRLTSREIEILHLVSKGFSNKEVGHMLGVSQFTIRNQLARICGKLEASDRTEAATTAMARGLFAP